MVLSALRVLIHLIFTRTPEIPILSPFYRRGICKYCNASLNSALGNKSRLAGFIREARKLASSSRKPREEREVVAEACLERFPAYSLL